MNNYEELVQKNEEEHQTLVISASHRRQEYIAAAGRFLEKWFAEYAKHVFTSQPAISEKLKPEDIKVLKADVKGLEGRAAEIATEHFSECEYWHDFSKADEGRTPRNYGFLNDAIRTAAAKIAPLFTKRGFRVQVETKGGRLQMGGTLGEDSEMADVRKRYEDISRKIFTNHHERRRLDEQQAQDKAAGLWDSA